MGSASAKPAARKTAARKPARKAAPPAKATKKPSAARARKPAAAKAPARKPTAKTKTPPAKPAAAAPPARGAVLRGVEADLREIKKLKPELATGGLAMAAKALAREIDKTGNSATSKSMCARALTETLDRLRELAPPKKESDRVDELTAAREARRAAAGSATS